MIKSKNDQKYTYGTVLLGTTQYVITFEEKGTHNVIYGFPEVF